MSTSNQYTGADLVAEFIATKCHKNVFLVTGGACAFMVDAIGRNTEAGYTCFQHEQSAAMAADAVWRTTGEVGVTMATSGPGATNLITGIACSWFDSIPSMHITGQVNQSENKETIGANVRQAGFQETDIVEMVRPITKYSRHVRSLDDLVISLNEALTEATTGRMGPVLLDIPMNIQKASVSNEQRSLALAKNPHPVEKQFPLEIIKSIKSLFGNTLRPMVIIGAGASLGGKAKYIQNWCEENSIPYGSSWGAMSHLDRTQSNYVGSIGVYGSRKANWVVQASDKILVLGSRLDNRQRTGNPSAFAPFAEILVLDIDSEELKKFPTNKNYTTKRFDLTYIDSVLDDFKVQYEKNAWLDRISESTSKMETGFAQSTEEGEFNPYFAVQEVQKKFEPNSIVVSDCGANLCWVYQSYLPDESQLFTAGGNSPMGYSLPAAIGAQLANQETSVYCFIGDGGLQMNIQELQTAVHYKLPITIIIQNNFGYGIIKQFQDAYFEGRHHATGYGYSVPNFEKIAQAYGIDYIKIEDLISLQDLTLQRKLQIIDFQHSSNSLITPKTEMNRFIHDQYPYIFDGSIEKLPFEYPKSPNELHGQSIKPNA